MLRPIIIVHRYLAVVVGVIMTLWCLSGFVMMYQGYPRLTEAERQQGLAPLDLSACCAFDTLALADDAPAPDVRVEMLLDAPVLRFVPSLFAMPPPEPALFDLRTGMAIPSLDATQAQRVAEDFGRQHRIAGSPRVSGVVEIDQWIVQTARRNQPLFAVDFDDAAYTRIYVSGGTGQVVQDTNRRERVLSWLGAVPHWLYPTQLRKDGELWSEVVIWTSLVGTFLTVTGLYVGIARFLRRKSDGRWSSPFRGWWYWHHITGLVFGVLTLTWVFSGLMTMNPWGLLVGEGAVEQIGLVRGTPTWGDVRASLIAATARAEELKNFKQLASTPLGGKPYVVASNGGGDYLRLDVAGHAAPLTTTEIDSAFKNAGLATRESATLRGEDDYYYRHENDLELPVYRLILDDEDRTRIYVHASTGAARGIDATMRQVRWIRYGLHDLDFAVLRERPIWDVAMLILMAGVTAVCVTGTWMALKRVRLDYRRIKRALRRMMNARAATTA